MRLLPVPALLALLAGPLAAQNLGALVEVRVPKAPTAVQADGKTHLIYELRVTNFAQDRTLDRVDVLGGDPAAPLLTLTGDDLKKATRSLGPGAKAPPDSRAIPGGRSATVFVQVILADPKAVPAVLSHRLISFVTDSASLPGRDTSWSPAVSVARVGATVITPPFAGGPWVAVNGPGNTSGHRRTMLPVGGTANIGQRFASDWIKLGADGAAFHGDSTVNANWYGYGTQVVAVGKGKVVAVKDGIKENTPLSPTMAVPITLETVGGNHVILELAPGVYAFYAHLQPGSIRVKTGDVVNRGDPIGLLGNSGNSTAPHLHFHLTDGNSPLGAEGIPFEFERFQFLGYLKGFATTAWKQSDPTVEKTREMPLENAAVMFPK